MLPFGIGLGEVLLVLVVILLVVGPRKLPEMAKTVGKGLRTVRRAGRELRDAVDLDDVRQEVYRPIRQWEQQQRIEDAQLLANDPPPAETRNADPRDADSQAAPDARVEERKTEAKALAESAPEPELQEPSAALSADAPVDEDAEQIVARGPLSMYKKPRLPTPDAPLAPEDDGSDTPG